MGTSWKILGVRQLLEELQADAELGRLVKAMQSDSSLCKQGQFYWAEWVGPLAEYPPGYQGAMGPRPNFCSQRTYNPIDALRSIQKEEGDV